MSECCLVTWLVTEDLSRYTCLRSLLPLDPLVCVFFFFFLNECGRSRWGGGVHGDLNQRILVWLLQTHMVTVGVHSEAYLNANSPCELYTLLRVLPPSWTGRSLEVCVCVCWGVNWLQDVLFVSGCLVTQPALLWLLPGHISHRFSLLFTFLMRGAGLCHMWLTAMSSSPPTGPLLAFWLRCSLEEREAGILHTSVFFWSSFFLSLLQRQRGLWEIWQIRGSERSFSGESFDARNFEQLVEILGGKSGQIRVNLLPWREKKKKKRRK